MERGERSERLVELIRSPGEQSHGRSMAPQSPSGQFSSAVRRVKEPEEGLRQQVSCHVRNAGTHRGFLR